MPCVYITLCKHLSHLFCAPMLTSVNAFSPFRGICDVSHLPLPRDHPAERHSPLFLAVWNVPLPLLCRQHQDRLPGRDWQESAAPRQSKLKTTESGALPLSVSPFPIQKGRSWGGSPRWFNETDSLNRTAGGFGSCLVVSWPNQAGSERV